MYDWLSDYDVYPRVVPAGRRVSVTVRPLGRGASFDGSAEYRFEVLPMLYRPTVLVSDCGVRHSVPAVHTDGGLVLTDVFDEEQEHSLSLYRGDELIVRFSVYSLKEDLYARTPLLGDLHTHSTFSDGSQPPEIVAAECRRRGYDFMAVTDHHNYAGSLAARAAYRNVRTDLNILPGEEVHLPGNDIHIVSFGGVHSVNFRVESNLRYARDHGIVPGTDPQDRWCALPGYTMPETVTEERYRAETEALAKEVRVPDGVERFPFLSCLWICGRIREADGLSIFAHPYWIKESAYQVPAAMTDALFEACPFDCFEVLGGEKYLNQNEFQTWHYVRQLTGGHGMPVVGNSDSHNMLNGEDSAYAATVVFAERNERRALIGAVREGYSVAVDLIGKEKRLVGDIRLVRYTRYLMDACFPAVKEICGEEGRLMAAYVSGTDPEAGERLNALSGRTARLRERLLGHAAPAEEHK